MSSQWPLLAASKFNPFFLTFYCILMLAKYCLDLGTLQTLLLLHIFKISVQCRNSIFLFLCDSHCHDQMSQAAGENNFGHLDFSATFVENFLMLQSTTDTVRNNTRIIFQLLSRLSENVTNSRGISLVCFLA